MEASGQASVRVLLVACHLQGRRTRQTSLAGESRGSKTVCSSDIGSDTGAGSLAQPPGGRCPRPGRGAVGTMNRRACGSEALLELTGAVARPCWAWSLAGEAARHRGAVVGSDGRAWVVWDAGGSCWGSCSGGMWAPCSPRGGEWGGADT